MIKRFIQLGCVQHNCDDFEVRGKPDLSFNTAILLLFPKELEDRERRAFEAGRQGTYIINDIVSNNLHLGKVQASFTFESFDDYKKEQGDE